MPPLPFARRIPYFLTIPLLFGFCLMLGGQTPSGQASSGPTPAPPTTSAPEQSDGSKKDTSQLPSSQVPGDNAELSSQDAPATFKVRVNLVLVRVVVRDAQGKVVTNLRKEDFQLLDNRKPQVISSFSAETPESQALKPTATLAASVDAPTGPEVVEQGTVVTKLPQRFVAVLFDDVHLSSEDSTFVRDAATRFFGALSPSDRVGIFTTSGQFKQAFTADREALHKSLFSIVPRSMTSRGGSHDCPEVT
jgi:hypothetical protein